MATTTPPANIQNRFRGPLAVVRKVSVRTWNYAKSIPPLYVGLLLMAAYAVWEAHTPVTVIAPFQMPNAKLPFTADIVADAVQDGLKSIHNEIEQEKEDTGLKSSDTGLPDLRNMLLPKFWRVQAPPRFAVEVKGVSYERMLSIARATFGTETTISGDVVMKGDQFILIARATDVGPWETSPKPTSPDGLKQASRELAEKILMAQDPTLAGVALLKDGHIDEGLAELNRAHSLKPTDPRLKLNLCMGFAASRRYDDAIECYKEVLQMKLESRQEVQERLAQAYYLKGLREDAIKLYEELVYTEGYRQALLGLGEAKDDIGDHGFAITAYDEFLASERQDRNKAIAHVKKGLALAHMHRHEEALNEYEEALRYAPRDVLVLVHEGLERAEATDLDAGIAQLKSVVEENQNSDSVPFARLQLGALLERKDDWRGAIEQYKMAADVLPNYVEAHLKLADALVHANKGERALKEYNKVAQLSASDLERGYSEIFANQWLANELRNLGDYADAASAYRKAIRFKPDNSAAHCQLSLILTRQGHLSDAIGEYGAALTPAKVQELNDRDCLAVADHVLDEAVASPGHKQEIAELRRIRQRINGNPNNHVQYATADNALRGPNQNRTGIEQAALRGDLEPQ